MAYAQLYGGICSKDEVEQGWQIWTVKRFKEGASHKFEETDTTPIGSVVYNQHDLETQMGLHCRASNLPSDMSYCVFKEGIKPKFEDKANYLGGRFYYYVKANGRDLGEVEQSWVKIAECLMNQAFGIEIDNKYGRFSDKMCGMKVCWDNKTVTDPNHKVQIWTESPIPYEHVEKMKSAIKRQVLWSPRLDGYPKYQWHSHRSSYIDLQKLDLLSSPYPYCDQCDRSN